MKRIKLYLGRNIQLIYYWIFVMVLLVPNFIILDIAPKPFYMMIPYLFMPMSVYMFLLSIGRKPGYMLIFAFPFVFIGAFQIVLITLSCSTIIGADMFTNIFTTNASEATDVLATLIPTLVAIFVLYGGAYTLAYFSIKSNYTRPICFYDKIVVAAPIMFIIGLCFIVFSYSRNPLYSAVQDIFPVNVANNLRVSVERWQRSKAYPETSKDFCFNATKESGNGREIYFLIVGESGRADRWGLYGYQRQTTPELAERGNEIIRMKDAVTESNTTHKSTALIMSSVSAVDFEKVYTQKSIVSAFNEAGFKSLFVSNQGANGSFMDFYASEASCRIDLPMREVANGHVVGYDGDALSHVRDFIDSNDGNLLIVVHTYGSHLQYHDRYTPEFEKFTPASSSTKLEDRAELNNAYDNTILYTDNFIARMIDIADSTDLCTAVMYVSDHGEDLFDDSRNRFLHSSPTLTYYQLHIPYLMWFSGEYKSQYEDKFRRALLNTSKAVSTSSVFHTILDMASVKTPYVNEEESIVNRAFAETPRMFLDDLYKPIYFANSGLQPIDFELMRKNNIKVEKKLIK